MSIFLVSCGGPPNNSSQPLKPNTTVKTAEAAEAPAPAPQVNNALAASIAPQEKPAPQGKMRVHFLDVGQGDSILIQTAKGKTVLIDAGPDSEGAAVTKYIRAQGIKTIDIVIGTHPHEDHIGGLDEVIKAFPIGKVYLPKVSQNTQTYAKLLGAIKAKGLKVSTARGGVELDLGQEVKARFLAPNGTSYEELNDYSAVLELRYGNTSFLFTGDAGTTSEGEMANADYNLDVDILKVGHHGSTSSSSVQFLKQVTPKYAVISVGADNSYGHPDSQTLKALSAVGAQTLRTDLAGTIVIEADGTNISVTNKRSSSQPRAPTASLATTGTIATTATHSAPVANFYVGNRNSHKFHLPSCSTLPAPQNRVGFASREQAINSGYIPCKRCNP